MAIYQAKNTVIITYSSCKDNIPADAFLVMAVISFSHSLLDIKDCLYKELVNTVMQSIKSAVCEGLLL